MIRRGIYSESRWQDILLFLSGVWERAVRMLLGVLAWATAWVELTYNEIKILGMDHFGYEASRFLFWTCKLSGKSLPCFSISYHLLFENSATILVEQLLQFWAQFSISISLESSAFRSLIFFSVQLCKAVCAVLSPQVEPQTCLESADVL